MVLTATPQVQQLLAAIVDNLDDLGQADPRRVKDPSVNWGTYYDQAPRVLVSRLSSPSAWLKAPTPSIPPPQFAHQASV